MNKYVAIDDIKPILEGKLLLPTITLWNRLEGRPRTEDFDRALKAEIRDPLWMLTKQWQMGEFEGDDAGSPITAKVHIETTELTKYRAADNDVQAFNDDVPLETKVEQRAIPFQSGSQNLSLDLRMLMGRRWLKLVGGLEPDLKQKFIARFAIENPDPDDEMDAMVCAHQLAWQKVSAVAGRSMDGWDLYQYLKADPTHHAYDDIAIVNNAIEADIETAEVEFISWYEALFYQPLDENNNAWIPERLEYAFECSAPNDGGEKHLVAEEYYHGHLDWYNLDISPSPNGIGSVPETDPPPVPAEVESSLTSSFIPTPINFDGMPHTRWWTFEDGNTNFGDIDADTTDINKLLLMEFALVSANDWFLMPFTVPAGTIANVRGMSVTNVFGERTWVEASGKGQDEDWQRWSMFSLNVQGDKEVPADLSLVVLPSVPKIQQSMPFDSVHLVRDEMANMVWGIETVIPLPSGDSKSGRSAGFDLKKFYNRLVKQNLPEEPVEVEDLENKANIRYQLMSQVPENWIPFIPVHIENNHREIQLRRAAMPRIIKDDPNLPKKIRPRSDLLRFGIDKEIPHTYDLHEEEVPRSSVQVSQSFQRTRWYDGQVFNWFGVRKQIGRGEKSSNLGFDRIRPKRRSR